ncbi:hypothetical protein [Magnetospirillum sp. UT-4]|uniref:hypothetical protein n=1 Tax=Magnetospirillum sp. UT-4 TaxID=2681467 RepID=UPI00137F3311|nr:hypothetical protein [Magnetospirillum sp. UT-4]CAA7621897.1 conserved hypothetical protein [Magnetospirillum sp. UT-4]
MTGAVITEEYRRVQRELHESNPDYGVASVGFAPLLADLLAKIGARTLLDYGAGKGRLGQELARLLPGRIAVDHYDPARPQWAKVPVPNDFVACIDVLEHIEPDLLDNVLDDLARVTRRHGFFTVHTGAAMKVLPDGRNAHLIQQPARWWLSKLLDRFDLLVFNRTESGFWVLVAPLDPSNKGTP